MIDILAVRQDVFASDAICLNHKIPQGSLVTELEQCDGHGVLQAGDTCSGPVRAPGGGGVMRRDYSCVDFGAILIVCLCVYLLPFLLSFRSCAFFLSYLLPYSFTS